MKFDKRKVAFICLITISGILVSLGVIALVIRNANSALKGIVNNTSIILNEIGEIKQENIEIKLSKNKNKSEVKPGDKGNFVLNINATESKVDVKLNLNISKENLPENFKFYANDEYERELTNLNLMLEQTEKQVTIYWHWDKKDNFEKKELKPIINITSEGVNAISLYESLEKQSKKDTEVKKNYSGLVILSNQNDSNKIMIYKGEVTNNNVIYAGSCWLIVRTTETGGVKIVYNGKANDDGTCNNFTKNNYEDKVPFIANSPYNIASNSPVHVGYMYNDDQKYVIETIQVEKYLNHLNDESIDKKSGRHKQNKYDSTIKKVIDTWYEKNINNSISASLLEDTVWCNERTLSKEYFKIENYERDGKILGFIKFDDLYFNLKTDTQLSCSRYIDKFTVSDKNGNGDLTYPIGLLTADEIVHVGILGDAEEYDTYLTNLTNDYVYTMTPVAFGMYDGTANVYMVYQKMLLHYTTNYEYGAVRPAVSLINETKIISGNGTFKTPYVID